MNLLPEYRVGHLKGFLPSPSSTVITIAGILWNGNTSSYIKYVDLLIRPESDFGTSKKLS